MKKSVFNKLISVLFFNILILIPLFFNKNFIELLFNWKIFYIIVINSIILLSQPAIKVNELKTKEDKNSGNYILIFTVLSIFFSVIEFSIFRRDFFYINIIGIIISIVGIYIRIKAIAQLKSDFSNVIKSPNKLKQDGLYSIIQHPSYCGSFFTYIGVSITLSQGFSILLSILLLFIAYELRIRYENKCLVDAFQNQATDYQSRTKKIIPFIW